MKGVKGRKVERIPNLDLLRVQKSSLKIAMSHMFSMRGFHGVGF